MSRVVGPLAQLFTVSTIATVVFFALDAGVLRESPFVELILTIATYTCLFSWISAESREFRYWPSHGYLLWVALAAPVVIPHFILRTRGWRGIWLVLGLELAMFAPALGSYLGITAYPHVPEILWLPEE